MVLGSGDDTWGPRRKHGPGAEVRKDLDGTTEGSGPRAGAQGSLEGPAWRVRVPLSP